MFPLNTNSGSCAINTTINFTSGYLSNCNVVLDCQPVGPVSDFNVSPATGLSSSDVTVFRLSSTATCKVNDCLIGQACRKDYWQTERTLNVEAKTI